MHQDATHGVEPEAARIIFAYTRHTYIADQLRLFSLKGKLRRVMKYESQSIRCSKSVSCRLKMSRQDVIFGHAFIG